jgi:hypothetical protein
MSLRAHCPSVLRIRDTESESLTDVGRCPEVSVAGQIWTGAGSNPFERFVWGGSYM